MSTRNFEREYLLEEKISLLKFRKLTALKPTCLHTVDSTQSFLVLEVHQRSEGDFVVSDLQTKGKGRTGRSWFSDEGGLYLSIMLTPRRAEIVDKIASMTTEVITNTLESDRGLSGCSLKLPNDVICRGKKIAGVLVDAELKGTEAICYLGVGIDLNNGKNWDEEMRKIATSFFLETGKTINIDDFLVNFLWRLDLAYSSLFSGN
jgi:BirA family transcriptional regulator, biotin operon repressor / biotin---[acetyl-CoA-carboxylase] ligase